MDLETLQSQMKIVIQKHQIVVTEMKKDPQNSVLQKQLHDLNSEIMSLSEKQKQIMQHLRNNLRKKQGPFLVPQPISANSQSSMPPPKSVHSQEVRMVCSPQKQLTNHRIATPVHHKSHSSSHSSVPANVTSTMSSCIATPKVHNADKSFIHLSSHSSASLSHKSSHSHSHSHSHGHSHHSDKHHSVKIDPEKKAFMAALGLISKDALYEMRNRRAERKRRSTANPHFSNAALEEKWKNAAAAAQALGPTFKRPRGRPRLETKMLPPAPPNGVCPAPAEEFPKKELPITVPMPHRHPVPNIAAPTVVNGIHRQISPAEEKKVEELLSNLCIVCTQPGDLVKCDTCAKQQHLTCMQPPLPSRPEGPWQCSECQTRTDPLTAVHSFDALKAAKEDEKRKLLKKSLELRLKRSQLEGKLYQLKDLASKQKDRQSELQISLKKTEGLMEKLQNLVTRIKELS